MEKARRAERNGRKLESTALQTKHKSRSGHSIMYKSPNLSRNSISTHLHIPQDGSNPNDRSVEFLLGFLAIFQKVPDLAVQHLYDLDLAFWVQGKCVKVVGYSQPRAKSPEARGVTVQEIAFIAFSPCIFEFCAWYDSMKLGEKACGRLMGGFIMGDHGI